MIQDELFNEYCLLLPDIDEVLLKAELLNHEANYLLLELNNDVLWRRYAT